MKSNYIFKNIKLINIIYSQCNITEDLRQHMFNVAAVTETMAKEFFYEEEINDITIAAALHDVGKSQIPKEILYKPSKLSKAEFDVIKKHSTYSKNILKEYNLDSNIISAVYYHHERYDGHGYPKGLQGDDIPVYSKLISIADAFDAMLTQRSYNIPRGYDEAMLEINMNSGTQFDPKLVKKFNRVIYSEKILC